MMNARDLALNIAVNMGRLARWMNEEKLGRVPGFLDETSKYVEELERTAKSGRLGMTFEKFRKWFEDLRSRQDFDDDWAEEALTWANILTHRAKLA